MTCCRVVKGAVAAVVSLALRMTAHHARDGWRATCFACTWLKPAAPTLGSLLEVAQGAWAAADDLHCVRGELVSTARGRPLGDGIPEDATPGLMIGRRRATRSKRSSGPRAQSPAGIGRDGQRPLVATVGRLPALAPYGAA